MNRTRSSARKNASRGSKPEGKNPTNDSRDTSADETPQRERNSKRPKKLARKKPQTQPQSNALNPFTHFPVDVLFEILGYLMPQDILRLSRTSKDFRALLTTRSYAFVWKSVLANVKPPPPPCPSGLNVMQYMDVLYGEHCFFCGSKDQQVDYALRLRFCGPCTNEHTYRCETTEPRLGQSLCIRFRKCVDNVSSVFILKTELDDVLRNLQRLSTETTLYTNYVHERKVFIEERCKFSNDCLQWIVDTKRIREQESRAILDARSDLMLSKLKVLGWSEEIEDVKKSYRQNQIPGISVKQPLTEKEWVSLKPQVITFFEDVRAKILEDKRNAILWERYKALKKAIYKYRATQKEAFIVRPHAINFLAMEPIQSLIFDTNTDQELTEDDFNSLKPHLLDISASIKESQDAVLAGLLPSRGRDTMERKIARLNLATTFFACHWCALHQDFTPIMYPRVLVHSCFYRRTNNFKSKEPVVPYNFCAYENIAPWNHDGITFNNEMSNVATTIVALYGEDPGTATVAHMDKLEVRLECLRCRGRQVMTWRIAVCHELERHPRDDAREMGWRKLDKEELILVHEIEDKERREEASLECDLCYAQIERIHCREHLIKTHRLTEVENLSTKDVERQFSLVWDRPMKQRPYAVKLR